MTTPDGSYVDKPVTSIDQTQTPRHLAIILDGNRRWARKQGLHDVSDGHRIGFGRIPQILSWCDTAGIKFVTLWMLSLDNIKNRLQAELDALYEIDADVVRKLVALGCYRLNFLGAPAALPEKLVAVLRDAEQETRAIDGMQVNLAIAYGGREDLLGAIAALVSEAVATGDTRITAESIAAHLGTTGQPDPDLIIRTSGEIRTSGFLLWQAALAEYYFCDCHFPEFGESDLHKALSAYRARNRRFGS
jgi:short-chain Z-isoprenyl diphosphate synthase